MVITETQRADNEPMNTPGKTLVEALSRQLAPHMVWDESELVNRRAAHQRTVTNTREGIVRSRV